MVLTLLAESLFFTAAKAPKLIYLHIKFKVNSCW